MINTRFEVYKLEREIKRSGVKYEFYRVPVNEWNERPPDDTSDFIGSITGIYHETNSQVTQVTSDGSVTRTKKQPALLCLCDEFSKLKLDFDDYVIIKNASSHSGEKKLKFVGAVDIANWGLIVDLSFEEVDHGN